MIAIRGMGSNIAKEFIKVVGRSGTPIEIRRNELPPIDCVDKYLICQGILNGKQRVNQTEQEVANTYSVNYDQVANMCNYILENNIHARICVIGSESGFSGSYDEVYSDSKHLLHHYVETKRGLRSTQQLVCVAPSIVEDAGMTLRRTDTNNLNAIRQRHPKGRFLTSAEVARMIYFLLFEDLGYTTGVVIRMNGGGGRI